MLKQGREFSLLRERTRFLNKQNDKMASVAGPIDMVKNNNIVSI